MSFGHGVSFAVTACTHDCGIAASTSKLPSSKYNGEGWMLKDFTVAPLIFRDNSVDLRKLVRLAVPVLGRNLSRRDGSKMVGEIRVPTIFPVIPLDLS